MKVILETCCEHFIRRKYFYYFTACLNSIMIITIAVTGIRYPNGQWYDDKSRAATLTLTNFFVLLMLYVSRSSLCSAFLFMPYNADDHNPSFAVVFGVVVVIMSDKLYYGCKECSGKHRLVVWMFVILLVVSLNSYTPVILCVW